ncbi:hypothetical protein [Actinophytocola sp.]|uniref:hypothetical protein n=1 Tax=Actinophytocola sp. TaxID=1872138 RepID=UPI003D6AF2A9
MVPAAAVAVAVAIGGSNAAVGLAPMLWAPFLFVVLAVLGFVTFLRPKVVVGISSVVVVNPLRCYVVPYPAIRFAQIGRTYVALALHRGPMIGCFALSSGKNGRLYHEALAKRMVDDVNDRRKRLGGTPSDGDSADGDGAAGEASVRRAPNWPSLAALGAGLVVAVALGLLFWSVADDR